MDTGTGFQRRAPGYLLAGVILDPASPQEMRRIDGAIAIGVRTETIREVGPLDRMQRNYPRWPVVRAEDCVILPVMADARTNWAPYNIRGRASGQSLLEWLEEVFVEEANFVDPAYAEESAARFFEDIVRQGTLTAFVCGPPDQEALATFFDTPRVGRWYGGTALMDALAPSEFRESTDRVVSQLMDCAFRFGHRFVITPRLVPACTEELLGTAGSLALDDVFVQTQLGMDADEVALVRQISADGGSAVKILDRAGLLNSRTLLAHCNHVEESDWRILSALDCVIVHTPGSDLALGAARMPLEKVREYNLRWALGSDVGAAPTLSMLFAMQSFLHLHEGTCPVTGAEALYRSCCVIPDMLRHETGRLSPGYSADFAVFHCPEAVKENAADFCLRALVEGSVEELEGRAMATIHRGHLVSGGLPELIF
ncbi:MAG: amidohydrolase family protein [Planctomycetota bacterium]